jgi:hypothetical protein
MSSLSKNESVKAQSESAKESAKVEHFLEVKRNFGLKGLVSPEDLKHYADIQVEPDSHSVAAAITKQFIEQCAHDRKIENRNSLTNRVFVLAVLGIVSLSILCTFGIAYIKMDYRAIIPSCGVTAALIGLLFRFVKSK